MIFFFRFDLSVLYLVFKTHTPKSTRMVFSLSLTKLDFDARLDLSTPVAFFGPFFVA